MIGSKGGGVSNKLMTQIPHLIHIRDFCHCLNLVIEDSLKGFPAYIIQFIRKVGNYLNSGQRSQHFKEFQISKGKKCLEVLQYKDERWTSLLECTERLLRLWDDLESFFAETPDRTFHCEFSDPEYKVYVSLLNILVYRLTNSIRSFEKSEMLFDEASRKLRQTFTIYARMLLKAEKQNMEFHEVYQLVFHKLDEAENKNLIADANEFQITFNNFQPSFEASVKKVHEYYDKKRSPNAIDREIYGNARNFISQILVSMKKEDRFPFENKVLNSMEAIYLLKPFDQIAWQSLAKAFDNIITPELELKFSIDLQNFNCKYKSIQERYLSSGMSLVKIWEYLSKDNQFPTLSLLAKALLVIPYSTAPVGSVFSEFRVFKTPYRNRLSIQNLQASILVEQAGGEMKTEMIERYFTMWEPEPQEKEEGINNQPQKEKDDDTNISVKNDNLPELGSLAEVNNLEAEIREEFHVWIAPQLNNLFSQWIGMKNNNQRSFLNNSEEQKNRIYDIYPNSDLEYVRLEGSLKSKPNKPLVLANPKPGIMKPKTSLSPQNTTIDISGKKGEDDSLRFD